MPLHYQHNTPINSKFTTWTFCLHSRLYQQQTPLLKLNSDIFRIMTKAQAIQIFFCHEIIVHSARQIILWKFPAIMLVTLVLFETIQIWFHEGFAFAIMIQHKYPSFWWFYLNSWCRSSHFKSFLRKGKNMILQKRILIKFTFLKLSRDYVHIIMFLQPSIVVEQLAQQCTTRHHHSSGAGVSDVPVFEAKFLSDTPWWLTWEWCFISWNLSTSYFPFVLLWYDFSSSIDTCLCHLFSCDQLSWKSV